MIFNSFKYSEINSSLDESEDDKFRGYGDIIKEMRLFKLNLMMSYIKIMIMQQVVIQMNNHFY